MAARRKQHVDIDASAMNAVSVSSPSSPSAPSAPPTTPRALRGEPLRHDDDDEEDDEGDAPEEISQGVARDRAMRSLKEAEDSRKKEKADVKEKRRHKHELYKEQKKRKMLSEDILKAVDEAESRKAAGPTKAKLSGHHDNDDDDDDDDDEEQESAPAVENRKKAKRGSSCYRVVRLRDEGLGAQKREEAQSFLQQRLYGQGRQRVSANEFFSLRNKTGACKKPALQFVKDGGAGMNKKDRKKRKREQAKTA
ncbi:U3 small nucleolar RNA-associated protein NOL7 [Lampetra planeri]